MKECIFWDNEDNKFISWDKVSLVKDKGDDFVIVMKEIDPICSEGRNFKSFDYIGLNDMNDKKIFADCSILKINYFHSLGDWISDIGYFSFDNETLRYCFTLINENEIVDYDPSYFDSLEIIDTIQVNKLGLIK